MAEETRLADVFHRIAGEYGEAKQQDFEDHPLADFIRQAAPEAVGHVLGNNVLLVKGSAGQSRWSDVPWLGVFNPEVTETATRGYYVIYLFAADMSWVHLCLAQGVTIIQEELGRAARDELQRRAALIRARVPEYTSRFNFGSFVLNASSDLGRRHEWSPAFGKSYDLDAMLFDEELAEDLQEITGLYHTLIARGGIETFEDRSESAATGEPATIEEQRRYRRHRRIELHTKASKRAKEVHGDVCQACGFDFEVAYGELGKDFIEAHHLIPLSTLPECETVPMDPETDFAVLCANCHRMAHRRQPPVGIVELRKIARTIP